MIDPAPAEAPAARRSHIPAAPRSPPQLTDGGCLLLAIAAAAGAGTHRPVHAVALVGALVMVAIVRRPVCLVLLVLLLASMLGHRSHAGLAPVAASAFAGSVTLVSDPTPTPFGERVDVRVGQRRVELEATGSAAGAVRSSLSGERLVVSGRLAPPPPGATWLVPRHVVGRLTVDAAERASSGSAPWRAANRFRRLLERGTLGLPETERSLYRGFVLGDDRNQAPEIVDDFRGAGLTHLLVVSGQNVAFVLVLARPLLQRMGWSGRWIVTLAVVGAFGLVTRFEPSVLRASAMAAVAVTAGAVGRPAGAVRTLGLSVAALLLVDPLLVGSTGFQLSVGASLAIALLAERTAARIPGPRPVADALGVTLAAEVGVAPVLIPLTGGLPVVSLLANPVAVPVAGLVTTWGLPAGVVAGLCGGWIARVVLFPVQVLIGWVVDVARVGASLPLGSFGWPHLLLGGGALVLATQSFPWRVVAVVLASMVVVAPAIGLHLGPSVVFTDGVLVRRGGGATVVVVTGARQPLTVLAVLRRAGVRRVDLLVATGRSVDELARTIRHRWPLGRAVDGSTGPPQRLLVGSLVVTVAPPGPPVVQALPP